ncbi:MAG: GTPase HflX, partial [Gammaproteobacteria bacterium]
MFFDRPESGERAVLVHVHLGSGPVNEEDPREFETLVLSAGGDPVDFFVARRPKPDARFFVGQGKLEEIAASVKAHEAEVVIFNHDLSPGQERNIEKALECRVVDRIGLILDIFAQRARTHEGKLQVELAQIQHTMSRLVRGWTHLERQRGGIGTRGGPGETQIELDRRLLRQRELGILRRLEKVRSQRAQGRRARQRAEMPAVSLVGYTNAGKSTLFNRMTGAEVLAKDMLFATLDPTMRGLVLPSGRKVILSDTVGFISDLPTQLVAAFRATLEEVTAADVIVHVRDIANPETEAQKRQVLKVLAELGLVEDAEEGEGGRTRLPIVEVWNKLDLVDEDRRSDLEEARAARGDDIIISLSALTGEGCDALLDVVGHLLTSDARTHSFV